MSRYDSSFNSRILHLDIAHKKIAGVCAGLANYFNTQRLYIRIAAVVILILSPLAAIAGYGLACFILDNDINEDINEDITDDLTDDFTEN